MTPKETITIVPEVGDYVAPDGWKKSYWEGSNVEQGSKPFGDGWPGCQFYLPTRFVDTKIGINVKVTGKVFRNRYGKNYRCRCRIEYVGDCEPSTFGYGWIYSDKVWETEIVLADQPSEVKFSI